MWQYITVKKQLIIVSEFSSYVDSREEKVSLKNIDG